MGLIDQPVEIRKGEELDLVKLNEYIQNSAPDLGKVVHQHQFAGGYSNLTYLLTSDKGDFILRRPPFGAAIKSAHDMGREFKVLSLLRQYYPKVPRPYVHCEDSAVLGAPFYLMERLHGVILRPASVKEIKLEASQMQKISEALIDNLAMLHSLDISATGLIQLGKPEGYIQRQVEGWTKRYTAAETDTIDTINEVMPWLINNQPPDAPPAFLHNDYKYDNVVLNEKDLTDIVGVL
ncbi:MAG: phosphotransferase family protein, partial [Cyclobacteriaceae bacterium]|nr:phosphotransferase family protein [Cyclobacteriaceae bacterium]